MMLLAIDTATDRASVAVGQGAEVLAQECIVGARRHASQLLPVVSACLDRAGIGLEQVEGILLADGPGSFTGLRVGDGRGAVDDEIDHALRLGRIPDVGGQRIRVVAIGVVHEAG